MTAEQKEIGDVMAEALRKLRSMMVVTARDAAIGEELARRWVAVSQPPKSDAAAPGEQPQKPA